MEIKQRKTLSAHCLVRNDEKFIGFAIRSVIDYVDQLIVFDTGSTDRTVSVVEALVRQYPGKITFEQKGYYDKVRHTDLRQEMLERTQTDWFMLLDGDEVHTHRDMEEVLGIINSRDDVPWIATPYYLCVGDVWHTYYKEKYDAWYGKVGFFTPRFIKRTDDMVWKGDYELDTLYTKDGRMVYTNENITFLKNKWWHLTHLRRSMADDDVFTSGIAKTRADKRRLTYFIIGKKIQDQIPEVFMDTEEILPLGAFRSFVNFFLLMLKKPRLILRRIIFILTHKEPIQ